MSLHSKQASNPNLTVNRTTIRTEVSVERSFSAMALILGPLRTRISDDNLENSLLIRLNKELFVQNMPK